MTTPDPSALRAEIAAVKARLTHETDPATRARLTREMYRLEAELPEPVLTWPF